MNLFCKFIELEGKCWVLVLDWNPITLAVNKVYKTTHISKEKKTVNEMDFDRELFHSVKQNLVNFHLKCFIGS